MGGGGGPTFRESTAGGEGTTLKEEGNRLYKAASYAEALRKYSQAISAAPHEGSLYGNRAACWMMVRKFERAVADCAEGLRREQGNDL